MTTAKITETDITVLAVPPTAARITEADITVLGAPPSAARITEADITVLAYVAPCRTNRCQVWSIARKDGTVFAYTSHDKPVTWGEVTYSPCKSLSQSSSQSSSELQAVGNLELTGILDDEAITEADIYSGLFDDAYIEAWVIPWDGLPDDGAPFRLGAGNMGRLTRGEHNFVAEVLGPGARLAQAGLVDVYTPACRWEFGDPETCGVDAEALKIAAVTVTGQQARALVFFTASDPMIAAQWNAGKVRWLTGRNAGVTCKINVVDFAAEALSLWDLAPYPPQAGDTFDLLPGCNLLKSGCDVYVNYNRYGGFEDVPGPDAMQSNADSLFTGS